MESKLLDWATQNSSQEEPTTESNEPIDPKWIQVLMGKSDAVRMTETAQVVSSKDTSMQEKSVALQDLLLLVESLDNANDLRPLKLWKPILEWTQASEEEIREYACWILGTAIQNNETCQADFINENGLEIVLKVLKKDSNAQVLKKALYCISCLVRANAVYLETFTFKLRGFEILANVLRNGNVEIRRKAVFLLSCLFMQDDLNPLIAKEATSVGLWDILQEMQGNCEEDLQESIQECFEYWRKWRIDVI